MSLVVPLQQLYLSLLRPELYCTYCHCGVHGLLTLLTPCFTALLRMNDYITFELLLQTQACMP